MGKWPVLTKIVQPLFSERRVFAPVRAAQPRTGRIATGFVAKFTFEHEDLLASKVMMGFEMGVGLPAHQSSMFTRNIRKM